jgi:SAM-dependent methyltransferase
MTVTSRPQSPLTGMEEWFRSPTGALVASIECAAVKPLLANTFGYYLVQIGIAGGLEEALDASRIRHRVRLPCERSAGAAADCILGLPAALPIASDSVDAVLLPHTLDFCSDPRAALGEVERILIPEGRVILIGFNALSAWGLRRLVWPSRGRAPWCGRFHPLSRVERWLAEFGFDVEVRVYLRPCLPLGHLLARRCAVLEWLGARLWPALGGIYVVRAVKRVATLTPLKPRLSAPSALLTGRAVRPSTRGTGHA